LISWLNLSENQVRVAGFSRVGTNKKGHLMAFLCVWAFTK
jgi:hypothetical protein